MCVSRAQPSLALTREERVSVIACYNVSKSYGEHWAVQNLDFHVPEASIFALVGPNGAGKSSTIKMLATLIEPTAGRILIDGFDAQLESQAVRNRVGYLPDHFTLYEDMTIERCLDFYGACFGLSRKARGARIAELLELLDLSIKRYERIRDLSRGMKQRVGIARALLHAPPVLLLDEPASGLDPAARIRLRKVLTQLKESGITILISSHILTELNTFCDSMAIMQRGKMLEVGRVEELQERLGGGSVMTTLRVVGGLEIAARKLREDYSVEQVERLNNGLKFRFSAVPADAADLVEDLIASGVRIAGLERGTTDLEWVYASISTDEVN